MVRRVYVEKKPPYAIKAKELEAEIKSYLGIENLSKVRILARYDIEDISQTSYEKALGTVFSEPPVDEVYEESFDLRDGCAFSVEYLPGQFDQRADSAEQCIKLLSQEENPLIRTATTYVLEWKIAPYADSQEAEAFHGEVMAIKNYVINPVDSGESKWEKPDTLKVSLKEPKEVPILEGFLSLSKEQLNERHESLNLAMTLEDFNYIRNYFQEEEKRDPSMTEIRVLDTYWSDHCRHTTFLTELKEVSFGEGYYKKPMEASFQDYLAARDELYGVDGDKFICLMDLALLAMKRLRKEGKLDDQEISEEINACSIVIPVDIDGKIEEWLLNFKNETHNHPTEIEPFGGAATCLGGAIRDPLSGRTYVYQAMRVTGAADPTVPVRDTMKGKLPQKKIVQEAAHGYSSYGNQIGLATGYVKEIYHPNYAAKRMCIGAVLGAAPRDAVKRLHPQPNDVVVLLGGRTGRDGIGGATGSSKSHTTESIDVSGAEVQKGNPPTERKIQRLFRRKEVASLIKKCNDFGAGGVSVAIGELADGLRIDLDKVPKKYEGLDGTELAISESQERMAVLLAPEDLSSFLSYAEEENLEAVEVAHVTEEPRLVLSWRGKEIVNLSRAFLDTNGAHQEMNVAVEIPAKEENFFEKKEIPELVELLDAGELKAAWLSTLANLNVCSQKGMVEMFDSTIGAASVLMPYGGKYQLTETQSMVAKLPVLHGNCNTVSMMAFGFDPYLSSWSPYHGAVYAVLESVARIVSAGGDYRKIRFTFQEYFQKLGKDPSRWSQPFVALLGAYSAQIGFGLPSVGGKDSMSGSFHEMDVPPTLVSFAVNTAKVQDIISPELKQPGNKILNLKIAQDEYALPVYEQVKMLYAAVHELIQKKAIISAYALDGKGIVAAISKMAFGNKLGITIDPRACRECMFSPRIGNFVVEVPADQVDVVLETMDEAMKDMGDCLEACGCSVDTKKYCKIIGQVNDSQKFIYGDVEISLEEALDAWTGTLETVFPTKTGQADTIEAPSLRGEIAGQARDDRRSNPEKAVYVCRHKIAKPTAFIPVFPGTNCEYDSVRAFEGAGADTKAIVFKNQNAQDIRESIEAYAKAMAKAQILMFPGGFSAGDEPEGSAKFFATAFRNEMLAEAVQELLDKRDGLILGICNGFQALIKLGLLPYGEIRPQTADSPTLTYNVIGRHVSTMAYTKVISKKSPWLALAELGKTYCNPVSHGEGRFVASEEWLDRLFEQGQVATQYVSNVNGSYRAIEGITSMDGRIFGKMAHVERRGPSVGINVYGEQDMRVVEAGVSYFK